MWLVMDIQINYLFPARNSSLFHGGKSAAGFGAKCSPFCTRLPSVLCSMSPAPLPNSWLLIPDARCTSRPRCREMWLMVL